jgi:spore maturation protein CgeB
MVILYVAMKHDYGRPEQGESFEHWNFYDSLARMGHTILYFDFMTLLRTRGREEMNRRLLEVARAEKPALTFSVLFRDEIDPDVVRRVPDASGGPTLNWFCDDVWRFEDFSRRVAPAFSWVVTTARSVLPAYARIGCGNVIHAQWACNHFLYRRQPGAPMKHDLTFVGQPHGNRRRIVEALRAAGLRVEVWGQGWDSGRIPQERMIEVFNQSRINLNLAQSSSPPTTRIGRAGAAARRVVASALRSLPGGSQIKTAGRRVVRAVRGARLGAGAWGGAARASLEEPIAEGDLPSQMKGRNFEVPGCGGFLLTDPVEDLERCYEPGREIVLFRTLPELIDRARHYLTHEEERASIARAAYERTLREHTYVHRFCGIFKTVGLRTEPPEALLAGQAKRGETVEIR